MQLFPAFRLRSFLKWLRRSLVSAAFALAFAAAPAALAKSIDPISVAEQRDDALKHLGWEAMKDPASIANFFITILGSIAIAAVLGFHPFHRQLSVEDMDQPKTIITYAVVGTFAAMIVTPVPALAYVIFGIGGLLRFRTDVGTAKNTGRAILGTIIGLAVGMGFWLPAIFGTAVAWILFAVLEYRVNLRMAVWTMNSESLSDSADAYGAALQSYGCRVVAVRKNPIKGQLIYVIEAKRGFQMKDVEAHCKNVVAPALQGSIDWPPEE